MLNKTGKKLMMVSIIIETVTTAIIVLTQSEINGTLKGAFFYSPEYIFNIIQNATAQELRMFIWIELIDLVFVIPIYTYCVYQLLNTVMYNFKQSPFKAFAFFPAIFDIPETVILLINNMFFYRDPIL